MLVIKLFKLIV